MNSKIHRPPGLVAVVVITAVFAVLGLLICGLGLFAVSIGEIPVFLTLLTLACFALSVAEAVVCFGLWNREDWACQLAQVVYTLNIILGVIMLFWVESSAEVVVNLVSTATYIWMLYYVTGLKGAAPLSASTSYKRNGPATRPPI
jgi:hypothetical protein